MGKHFKPEGWIARGSDVPIICPHDVVIVGLDVPDSDDYWFCCCPRAADGVEEEFIDSIRQPNEVRTPIDVCRDGNRVLVLAGRRRIKAARIIWDPREGWQGSADAIAEAPRALA
jgi:hypothetical protein